MAHSNLELGMIVPPTNHYELKKFLYRMAHSSRDRIFQTGATAVVRGRHDL
jgi:hypothetical protein